MLRKLLVCVNWLINWLIVDRRPNGDDHEHRRTEHTYYKLYANICCLNYSMFEDNLSLYASTCRKKKKLFYFIFRIQQFVFKSEGLFSELRKVKHISIFCLYTYR